MKGLILLNSDDGFIVQEVDAKMCDYDSKCFIRRDVSNPKHKLWYLVDKDTGQFICYAKTQNQLKEWYLDHKDKVDEIRKSPKYKIKIERFEKAKLVSNYSKGVK